jgi:hypothetical protein
VEIADRFIAVEIGGLLVFDVYAPRDGSADRLLEYSEMLNGIHYVWGKSDARQVVLAAWG